MRLTGMSEERERKRKRGKKCLKCTNMHIYIYIHREERYVCNGLSALTGNKEEKNLHL